MTHVRVQRLGAGHGEEDGAQRDERRPGVYLEEPDRVQRVDRLEHARFLRDLTCAEDGEGEEPQRHDRAEQRAHPARAAVLHQEQANQDGERDRHDVGLEHRGRDFQTFDSAQN
jgi:hypothetical protein